MNVISLFAGCGGLDLGFEKAGFNIIWANEYDESIHETYRFNHPNTILNTSDIRTLSGNDIPDCDGIIGGPPCQAWSEGGKRLGIEDPRGQLFLDYIRIVKDKKPKFFVIENVQGILDEIHKESLESFINALCSAGYNVTYELLNAADYKIPQDRFRVFFVGIRKDLKNTFVFPNAACTTPITLRQAISDITEEPRYYNEEYIQTENDSRPNHDVYTGVYDSKYMSRNRVRSWDEPSFTMQAQARNAPQHPQAPKMTYISSSMRIFAKGYEHLYRRLSVRECARIQSFPDNFRFIYKDVKDGYKMVGNAVPPRLAWYIAVQIKDAFNNSTINIKEQKVPVIQLQKLCRDYIDIKEPSSSSKVLISLVKNDFSKQFIDQEAHCYYTGKFFPSSIEINNIQYFVPYIKGKGIRDLYRIKSIRIGMKMDVVPESNDHSQRLIFEIEYIKTLFPSYMPIHLNIWNTFSEYQFGKLISIMDNEEN